MLQIVFIFSLVMVTLMVVVRTYEYEKKKETFFARFFARYDARFELRISKLLSWFDLKIKKIYFALSHELPRHTKYFFLLIKKSYREKYDAVLLDTRGTRVLKQDGEVSSYLKDLSQDKMIGSGGEIVDNTVGRFEEKVQ